MAINQIEQIAGEQQGTQIADVKSELRKIEDRIYNKNIEKSKAEESRHVEKALQNHSKGRADKGTKVLANLFVDLGKIGMPVDFSTAVNKSSINKDLDEILGQKPGDEDKYNVKNASTQDAIKNIRKRAENREEKRENESSGKEAANSDKVRTLAQEYAQTYAGYAVASSPEAKTKLDDLKKRLGEEGLSDRELAILEKGVGRTLRKEMVSRIQDSFLSTMLSPEKSFDFVISSKRYKDSVSFAVRNAEAFGINDGEDVSEFINSAISDSHGDLRDFVHEKLEQTLLEKNIAGRDVRDDVKRLVQLGSRVGFNPDQFMNVWMHKKVDLGLVAPEIFAQRPLQNNIEIAIGGVGTGSVSDRHPYSMTMEDDKEVLTNRLRALFMKKALVGDFFSDIEVTVKIRKTKNGLIKLGLTYEDLGTIEKEGRALARFRTLAQLKEAFMERATFYKLSGSGYDLVFKKIKGLTANLEKLGFQVSRDHLDTLRDDANSEMFDHTVVELKWAVASLKNGPNPRLRSKAFLMITLLKRIKEESGFTLAHGEDVSTFISNCERELRDVKESA